MHAPQFGLIDPAEQAARRAATCERKKTYFTRDEAKSTAKRLNRLKRTNLKPYRCVVCGLYHLTKEAKR